MSAPYCAEKFTRCCTEPGDPKRFWRRCEKRRIRLEIDGEVVQASQKVYGILLGVLLVFQPNVLSQVMNSAGHGGPRGDSAGNKRKQKIILHTGKKLKVVIVFPSAKSNALRVSQSKNIPNQRKHENLKPIPLVPLRSSCTCVTQTKTNVNWNSRALYSNKDRSAELGFLSYPMVPKGSKYWFSQTEEGLKWTRFLFRYARVSSDGGTAQDRCRFNGRSNSN